MQSLKNTWKKAPEELKGIVFWAIIIWILNLLIIYPNYHTNISFIPILFLGFISGFLYRKIKNRKAK